MKLSSLRFRPALLDSLRTYRRQDLMADVGAGLTVACVALPLAMAFGIASGVKPEQGLITAIIGGALVSLLGGSKVQIGGPAGAFVAMLYGIALQYGMSNLLLATRPGTLDPGAILFLMGALRLGQIIRFVPISIVIGFTNGIAVVIMLSQMKDFLGLQIEKMPANFFSQLDTLVQYRDGLNFSALGLGVVTLLTLIVWPKPPKVMTSRQTALEQPAQGVVGTAANDAGDADGRHDVCDACSARGPAGQPAAPHPVAHSSAAGGAAAGHAVHLGAAAAGRDHRQPLRRHSAEPAGTRAAQLRLGISPEPAGPHAGHCLPGGHRIAAVRTGGRRHDP